MFGWFWFFVLVCLLVFGFFVIFFFLIEILDVKYSLQVGLLGIVPRYFLEYY